MDNQDLEAKAKTEMPTFPSAIDLSLDAYEGYLENLAERSVGPRLRTQVDPLDLVQQTLLRAYQAPDNLRKRGERQVRGWLRSILSNLTTDYLRRSGGKNGETRERSLDAALDRSSANFGDLLHDDASTPSHKVNRKESLLSLEQAMRRLPEEQRVVVRMRHIEEASLAEIAERTGKSVPSVAGLLRRGLESLRAELQPFS